MKFDFGEVINEEKYGQSETPAIDLNKVKGIPIIMLGGEGDLLSDIKDVRRLKETLINEIVLYKEYDFGHMTFLIAKDMGWFKTDVIDQIEKYMHVKI